MSMASYVWQRRSIAQNLEVSREIPSKTRIARSRVLFGARMYGRGLFVPLFVEVQ